MSDITVFENTANSLAPAWMRDAASENSDLTAHASESYRILSIKGKVFTKVISKDEREIIPNPKDPESAAQWIPIVLVKVNGHVSKSYYKSAFSEGQEDNKPTCFSTDGKRPDASAAEPQCKTCAACKWNQFGTASGKDGLGKGKACSDYIRAAVTVCGDYTTPYFLRVPPASMKNLGEYGKLLAKHKYPYSGVATRLSFDKEQATPRLVFQGIGFLNQQEYEAVKELAASDEVKRMLNPSYDEAEQSPFGEGPALEAPAYMKPSASTTVTAPKEAKPAATVDQYRAKTADELIEATMGAPAAAPAPVQRKPEPQQVVSSASDLSSALAGISFDD